ncbi:hypothetical protein BS78_05G193400 [Paspalum vaginatum]|nr:hypothetical protein BS78_05G193400 [Paspalum vaginatum]
MRACVQVHQVTSSRRCPMKVQIEASNRGKYHCYHQTTKVQADQVLGPWLRRARQNTGASPARWERGRTRRRNLQSTPQFSCPINKGFGEKKSKAHPLNIIEVPYTKTRCFGGERSERKEGRATSGYLR